MAEYFAGLVSSPRMIVAQIIGFLAMTMAITAFQQKERKKLLMWQLICVALWTLHFIILGVVTGAAINFVQVMRTVVFYNKETKKWAQWNGWLVIFLVLTVIIGIITWEGPMSILPIIGTSFSTVSVWMKKPFVIRLLTFPVSITWGIYDLLSMSFAGAINEVFCITSIIIAIFRIDIPKLKEEKKQKQVSV